MPQIMTTKELAKYLKLHEITICKYAAEGKIPSNQNRKGLALRQRSDRQMDQWRAEKVSEG